MSFHQHTYPCPQCRTSRESLEAPCSKCGWAPPSIIEVQAPSPRTNFANLAFLLSVLGLLVAALAVRWFTDDLLSKSREAEHPPQTLLDARLATVEMTWSGDLIVVKSVPVLPGTLVDIIAVEENRVLLSQVKVTHAQWKVPEPFQPPQYPASGFVVVTLYESEWAEITEAGEISVQPSE